MNSMKKIIPALCLLLVSAMLLGTSTYAWFSMNTTVTATGMVVKAQATSTLLIDTASAKNTTGTAIGKLSGGASTKATTATAPESGLMPTSTINGSNWFKAEAAAANDEVAKAGAFAAIETDDLANYRLANTFYLQTFDATKSITEGSYESSGKKLVVNSVTVSYTTSDTLAACFRVMVVIGSQVVVCAPTTTTTPTNQGVSSVSTGTASKQTLNFATVRDIDAGGKAVLAQATNTELVAVVNYNEVYTANVYLYFDGEDGACFTDNIPDELNNYTVTVEFGLVD